MRTPSRSGLRRRARTRRRIGLGVLALLALGGGLVAGLVMNRAQAPVPEPSPSASQPLEPVPLTVRLLAISSTFEGGSILSTAPLLIGSDVTGGAPAQVLLVDVGLRAVGPAREAPLPDHAADFGPEGLSGAVRNELGLRIDEVASVTEAQLAGFLDGFGALSITVASTITEAGEPVYVAGTQTMTAAEAVTYLAFPFEDPSIDALEREAAIGAAWRSIVSTPGFAGRLATSTLPGSVQDALAALTTATIEELAVADTSKGPVLDELGYRAQADLFEGAWLDEVDPFARPRVELRGRSIVEAMLLLIADGIRVERVRSATQATTTIETGDQVLGTRIADLIQGEVREPAEPLGPGLDARITLAAAA